jgi:hypothetical protein
MSDDKRIKPQGWDVKVATIIPAKHSPTRVDISVEDFEKLLREKGSRVRVFRTVFCPNVKSIDGAEHNIDCDLCNGSGFLDARPIETVAFIQNQVLEKMPFVEGMVDGNSVAVTFPTGIELQYFTLMELMDFQQPYFQRVKRQQGQVDVLKYRAHRVNFCVDQHGKEYFPDADFGLDDNGSILWTPNKGPDPDTIYSIHYEAAVQFRAVRAMHSNRYTQVYSPEDGGKIIHVKLPEQWMLSKEFLVKRKDRDGNEILPNLIVDKQDAEEPEDPFER